MSVSRRLVSGLILATAADRRRDGPATARRSISARPRSRATSSCSGKRRASRGLSGVLIQDGSIVWERGLGFADVEARIPARPDTPYLIGDLTEAFTAVLVLQCYERRRIDLEPRNHQLRREVPNDRATVRQVLSHTSAPGTFKFEPARTRSSPAWSSHARQPFRKAIASSSSIVSRWRDRSPAAISPTWRGARGHARQSLFRSLPPRPREPGGPLQGRQEGIRPGRSSRPRASTPRPGWSRRFAIWPSSTSRSTTARFSATRRWRRPGRRVGARRRAQPTGLGWFVQSYRGVPLVWQYGVVANAYSGMIVLKIPSRRVTMILLANSDGLANSVPARGRGRDAVALRVGAAPNAAVIPPAEGIPRSRSSRHSSSSPFPPRARAEWQFTPFIGYTFKATSTIVDFDLDENRVATDETRLNFGGAVRLIGEVTIRRRGLLRPHPGLLRPQAAVQHRSSDGCSRAAPTR